MNCVPANNHLLVVPSNPGKLWYIYPHLHSYLEEVDKYKFQYFIFHETTTPYILKAEGVFFLKYELCMQILLSELCLQRSIF